VYVYGSQAAVEAMRAVASELPPSLTGLRVRRPEVSVVRAADFNEAYRRFQDVMCAEVSAEPRLACAEA
jgi:hypothetical protein